MKMKKFERNPVDYQNYVQEDELSKDLEGAVHVETYTKKEDGFGDDRTIIIFAFYPDDN